MLKFFRKIRQKFLVEGQLSRYMLYAIGEILLVMVGILLALQVNNWNEERKNRQLEINYLRNFLLDLRTDSLVMEQNKKILREEKMPGLWMINRLLHSNTPCCKDSVKWAIANSAFLGWAISQERSTATRDEIVSSGNLRLISNEELRVAIIRYYTYWEHALDRTNQRKSGYPNFTYELFDLDAPQDDAEWFHQTLRQNDAELEFRRKFRHEMRYAQFIERVTLKYLTDRMGYLQQAIQMELEGKSNKLEELPPEDW